jgi:hypothetical protein
MPADEAAKDDYFDSLYFSAAVVGLNTSAFLEAGIIGRPVHVILPPRFHDNQEGTIHFDYLRTVGGGLVQCARDFASHHRQLLDAVNGAVDGRKARFVDAFIRPHGRDVPASQIFADAVESLAETPAPVPLRIPAALGLVRALMLPAAVATRLALGRLADAEDKTSRDIRGARIREERARTRAGKLREVEDAAALRQQERDREKAMALEQRLAAKELRRQERERRAAENTRQKTEMHGRKQRDKRQRQRRKQIDLLRQRILHMLGRA